MAECFRQSADRVAERFKRFGARSRTGNETLEAFRYAIIRSVKRRPAASTLEVLTELHVVKLVQ